MFKSVVKHSQLILGLIFLVYFIYTLNNAFKQDKHVVFATILSLILYVQSVGVFLYFYKSKGKPRLQDWMRVMLFYSITLDFMKSVNSSNGEPYLPFIDNDITILTDATFTLFVVIVTFFTLDLGYLLYNLIKNKPERIRRKAMGFKIVRKDILLGILIFTTIFQFYFILSGLSGYGSNLEYTYGSYSFIKSILGNVNSFAFILVSYVVFIEGYKRTGFRKIFFIIIITQILFGLLSGMKEAVLTPILYSAVPFFIGGGKLKKQYILVGGMIILLLYPINNAYRSVINDPYLKNNSSIINMGMAASYILENPISESLSDAVESYGSRTSMYGYFQNSIEIENTWDYYKHMNRYVLLPLVWIVPRSLWSTKPRADVGSVYYEKLVDRSTNSITPTNIGWAYFEGGLVYVIIIFLLISLLFSKIDSHALKSPMIVFFYAWCFHKALKPEWDPYFMFAEAIQTYVLCWLVLKYLGIKKYDKIKIRYQKT